MERKRLTRDDVVDFVVRAVYNFIAELIGTGVFIFVGCLSCLVGNGTLEDPIGVTLSFAFAIMVGVEIAVQISGGHLNPIVTVASMFFRKTSIPMGIIYILAQFSGSLLGFGLIKALTPGKLYLNRLCCTIPHPNVHIAQAVFIEFIASSILVLMVCAQWNPRNTRLETITIRIGFTIFCLLYATIHLTGGSLNPARSFGPAVWNNVWKHHWIYWVGPLAAGTLWPPIYVKIFVEWAPKEKKDDE